MGARSSPAQVEGFLNELRARARAAPEAIALLSPGQDSITYRELLLLSCCSVSCWLVTPKRSSLRWYSRRVLRRWRRSSWDSEPSVSRWLNRSATTWRVFRQAATVETLRFRSEMKARTSLYRRPRKARRLPCRCRPASLLSRRSARLLRGTRQPACQPPARCPRR